MKKIFTLFLLLMIGFGAFAQSGVVREISGTVELKHAGTTVYVPVRLGDEVRQNTIISTGFRSTTLIEVGSTVIAVRPLTRLTLTQISSAQDLETFNVNLQAGRVRVDVNPPAGRRTSMTVTSPSASASVRGTSFDFDTRNLLVSEGTVNFRGNRGYEIAVNAGSSTTVMTYTGRPQPPQPVNNAAGITPPPPVGKDLGAGNTGGTGMLPIGGGQTTDPGPTTPTNPTAPVGPATRPPTSSDGGVEIGITYPS